MICSTLASLWKFQYFRMPIYNPVEHLWWSFYYGNSKPLSTFTKTLHRSYSLVFYICLCFLKTLQTLYFFKAFYIIRLLKSIVSLKHFISFSSSNMFLNIYQTFDLLITIPLTRTKTLINNLLMSKVYKLRIFSK